MTGNLPIDSSLSLVMLHDRFVTFRRPPKIVHRSLRVNQPDAGAGDVEVNSLARLEILRFRRIETHDIELLCSEGDLVFDLVAEIGARLHDTPDAGVVPDDCNGFRPDHRMDA